MNHTEFTLARKLSAGRDTVWEAWADPALKKRWFVDGDGPEWNTRQYSNDFRVGGREEGSFELTEGPGAGLHENVTFYLDIVPHERIAFAYTMAMNGRVHSASLATVTFAEDGDGTRMTFTEQGAYFEGSDGVEMRREGWEAILGNFERVLGKG